MIQFLPLASSSLGCCYVLSGGGAKAPLLLDAGIRYKLIQIGMKFQVTTLAGCLISHAHGDHIAAAKDLMANGVDCYASEETWKAFNPSSRHHRSKTVELARPFTVGDWTVLACEAVHDAPGTFGFLIGSPNGERILYLTDSAYVKNRFEGLTHICIEANFSLDIINENKKGGKVHASRRTRTVQTHMSIDTLIDMLKKNDLSKVQEIHLLHLSAANSDAEEFKLKVQQATGKPVYIADILSRDVLS